MKDLIEKVNKLEDQRGLPRTTEEMLVLNGFQPHQRDITWWEGRRIVLEALIERSK